MRSVEPTARAQPDRTAAEDNIGEQEAGTRSRSPIRASASRRFNDSRRPTDPTLPAVPYRPDEPAAPAMPCGPCGPAGPTDPAGPAGPFGPANVYHSAEPGIQ